MCMSRLAEIIKKNRILYVVYCLFLSLFINTIKLFIKTDDKLILFVSYGGRYFNDSPKCIYEEMRKDERFKDYKLVWAFRSPRKYPVNCSIKIDSFRYYVTALAARCWVTNVIIERGLKFSGKNTYYFHTAHGVLPKLTGNDSNKGTFGWDYKYNYDCSCAQSEKEKSYQISAYGLNPSQILVCGYPKNDALNSVSIDRVISIKRKLGIPLDKKILLYAPTFRENNPTGIGSLPRFSLWRSILGNKYVVLFRAHPIVSEALDLNGLDDFVYDVSDYQDNMDIMIIADALISDYSGIFFEYCILERPMYCFAYDFDEYIKTRGLYFDIRNELPGGNMDEESLIKLIASEEDVMGMVREFSQKYVTEYGHATQIAVDNIFNNIHI